MTLLDGQDATRTALEAGNSDSGVGQWIRDLVRAARAETQGFEAATELAVQRLLARTGQLPEEAEFLVREALAKRVRDAAGQDRVSLTRTDWSPPPATGTRIAARLRNQGTPYDWSLPGGKPLGAATLDDIRAARQFHESQAEGHKARARFYRALERRLTGANARTVREAISEDELKPLLAEMKND